MPWPRGSISAASLRIVVADGSDESLRPLVDALHVHGHAVETATDGRDAYEWARRSPPDIVLLDLELDRPSMNGHELVAAFAADRVLRRVPIAVITGAASRADLPSGVAAVFTRPVDVAAVLELVTGVAVTRAHTGPARPAVPLLPREVHLPRRETPIVEGMTRVRSHCSFHWIEVGNPARRTIDIEVGHCRRCIAELRQAWPSARFDIVTHWGART